MSPARKTFFVIFGLAVVLGVGMGVVNWIWPGAASITWNDAPATGLTGVIVAGCVWGIFGLIFGLIVAGIVALFTRPKAKA